MQLRTEEICFKFSIRCEILPKKPQISAASAMDRSKPNREKNVGAQLADRNWHKTTEFKES